MTQEREREIGRERKSGSKTFVSKSDDLRLKKQPIKPEDFPLILTSVNDIFSH